MHEEEANLEKRKAQKSKGEVWFDGDTKSESINETRGEHNCARCGKKIPPGSRAKIFNRHMPMADEDGNYREKDSKMPYKWVTDYFHINEDCNNQPQGEAKPRPEAVKQIDLFEKEENKT